MRPLLLIVALVALRPLLLIVALVALPIAWLAVIWLLVRDRAPAALSWVTVNERLNIALLVLAVVSTTVALISVAIGVAAYRRAADITRWQLEAGNQQSKTLQSQTEALVAAREALATMSQVTDKNREALEAEIDLLRTQQAAEQARQSRRPRLEIDFGTTSWMTLRQVLEHKTKIAVLRDELKSGQARFTVRNVGEVTLVHPVVVLSASDPAINVQPRQFSGPDMQDVAPYSIVGKGYTYETKIDVPPAVGSFELTFEMFGDNMPVRQLSLPIVLVDK